MLSFDFVVVKINKTFVNEEELAEIKKYITQDYLNSKKG